MTEYAHNHPPRCCCDPENRTGIDSEPLVCPVCPEHGELAQLGKADYPGMTEAEKAAFDAALTGNGYLLDGRRIPPEDVTIVRAGTPEEYLCCHQLAGRPHTDYCPTRCGNAALASQQPYSGEPTIIKAADHPNDWTATLYRNPLGMTHEPQHHTTPDGDTHPVHQCHPDRCGMWVTTTSQPPTQTSTPSTQARNPDDLVGHLRDAVDRARERRTTDQVVEDNKGQRWHQTGPDEAHETWQCSLAKCGRERTPLGDPTPGCTCDPGPLGQHQPYCGDYLT